MGIHLIGGGLAATAALWRPFVREATAYASGVPRIAVITVRDGDGPEDAARLVRSAHLGGPFEPVVTAIGESESVPEAAFDGVHAILVGGGLTPAYRAALLPVAHRIRALVADGAPYAGFSAGAAIAAEHAIVGGWRHGDQAVSPEAASEELDALAVLPGLALVPFAVDVHTAQWGTLSRAVAAVDAGLVRRGVALDEDTALVVTAGESQVVGAGAAWWVEWGTDAVLVRREVAA